MKYIVCLLPSGLEKIFLFPKSVNHDDFHESIAMLKTRTAGTEDWIYENHECISAGFVHPLDNMCYGRSETLNLDSREQIDTALLAATLME